MFRAAKLLNTHPTMSVVVVPAGRSYRRTESAKWVDPQPEKGVIEINLEQEIVNFIWRNNETNTAEDELLIFPGEATFERVAKDPTGRSFCLKFNSSNQVHFFWLQRGTLSEADWRATTDINALLQDPSYHPGSAPIEESHRPSAASASSSDVNATPAPAARTETPGAPVKASAGSGSKQNEDMARLLFQWADNNLPIPDEEEASLADILTPETVGRLLTERPELAQQLAQHMPPDLELADGVSPSSAAGLERVVGTPQFRDAVGSLEMALRNGNIPDSMVPWAHTEGGVWNLRSFLAALREVSKEDKDEKMDED